MSASSSSSKAGQAEVIIRLLREEDLAAADRIMRLAFGTFIGLPDPLQFMGDADYVRTRWRADASAALAAEMSGELVGTNLVTRWGSVGFFGPLTIRPDLWGRGIAQELLRSTMELFDRWRVSHAGLYTFANSAKHVSLYQKFGFWPRFLTALMDLPVGADAALASSEWTGFSTFSSSGKQSCLDACHELTSSIYDGLDVEREIRAADEQQLGETILTWNGATLAGLAVCHAGAGSEAGSGKCYVKFGAVRSGAGAVGEFRRLLGACSEFARSRGAKTLSGGMNLSRLEAYREMLQAGFRTTMQGVVMERNAEPGYNRPGVYLIDDWR